MSIISEQVNEKVSGQMLGRRKMSISWLSTIDGKASRLYSPVE